MGDFADDYGGYDFYDRMELDEQRDSERRAQRAKLLTLPEPAQKPMHPELRKMWEDYFDKCFREFIAAQLAPVREDWGPGPHEVHSLPSQPAPVQEPVAWVCYGANEKHDIDFFDDDIAAIPVGTKLYTTPPAAQRQWRGLTDKEFEEIIMSAPNATVPVMLWQLIQDKLKEKNT